MRKKMEVICKNCEGRFKISDEKLPGDHALQVVCPKCKNKIVINPKVKSETAESCRGSSPEPGSNEIYSSAPDVIPGVDDEPKSSFFAGDKKTALICEDTPENQGVLKKDLEKLNYYVQLSTSEKDALDKMRFNRYNLIILNEEFAGCSPSDNPVLQQIQSMPMVTRRDIFFTLIGKNFRTLDNMTAFSKSANLVVNIKDIVSLKQILQNALDDNDRFYQVFKNILKEAGKK